MKIDDKQLKRLAKKHGIEALYLFGSQATSKATPLSDYDFAVIFSSKIQKNEYGKKQSIVISELSVLVESKKHIDLIVLNDENTPLLLKFNIIKEGKLIFEADKNVRVDMEVSIMSKWFDWEYYERLWSEIYVGNIAAGKF